MLDTITAAVQSGEIFRDDFFHVVEYFRFQGYHMSDTDSHSGGGGSDEENVTRIVAGFEGLGIDPYRSEDFIVYFTTVDTV